MQYRKYEEVTIGKKQHLITSEKLLDFIENCLKENIFIVDIKEINEFNYLVTTGSLRMSLIC